MIVPRPMRRNTRRSRYCALQLRLTALSNTCRRHLLAHAAGHPGIFRLPRPKGAGLPPAACSGGIPAALSCDPWICGNRPWRAERGSRAWTNPWTGKKTPAHRFAHHAPLFHIPTGAIATLKKPARSRAKGDESGIPAGRLFFAAPGRTLEEKKREKFSNGKGCSQNCSLPQ